MGKSNIVWDHIEIAEDGGRKSGKTFNVIKFACGAMLTYECDVASFRWLKGEDAEELFKEHVEAMEFILGRNLTYRQEINHSSKTIKLGGNYIQVRGINSANKRKKVKLVGAKRAKGKKFLIIILEERYEFSEEEVLSIRHGLGGYKHVIVISITNPHSLAYPYIKQLDSYFKHDKEQLEKYGEQYKFEEIKTPLKDGKTQVVWRCVHYTNWRVNHHLSKADIYSIQQAKSFSKSKYRVADLGMPGQEEGAIYSEEIDRLIILPIEKVLEKYNIKSLAIGVDLGNGSNEFSSATAMSLVGFGAKGEQILLHLYYNHNKDKYVSNTQHAKIMVNTIVDLAGKHQVINDIIKVQGGIEFHCDWDFSFMELLETAIASRNISNWMSVQKAYKHPLLARIAIRKHLLSLRKYIVVDTCIRHLEELEIQKWSETKKDKDTGRHMPEDMYNDTTDSFDYAAAQNAYTIFEDAQFKFLNKNIKFGRMR